MEELETPPLAETPEDNAAIEMPADNSGHETEPAQAGGTAVEEVGGAGGPGAEVETATDATGGGDEVVVAEAATEVKTVTDAATDADAELGATGVDGEDAPAAVDAEEAVPSVGAPMVQTSVEELLADAPLVAAEVEDARLRAVLEAIIYVAEEPLTLAQMAAALGEPAERIRKILEQLGAEYDKPEHGITVREVAGGYKMATKAEHHEGVRSFVKSLKPPLKLSLPALETLAVIAYKQPVTAPEIMEIRGVQGVGVLKTLLDRKLIAMAGRKNVIGKPRLYKTTKEFLIQFGLRDLSELPSLKEFEEIRRMALSEGEIPAAGQPQETAVATLPVEQATDPASEPATPVEAAAATGEEASAEPPASELPAADPPASQEE